MISTGTLQIDANHYVIQTGGRFTTKVVALSGTTYNKFELPDNTAEIMIQSTASFTVASLTTEDGFVVAANTPITLGVTKMDELYIKGANLQNISVIYIHI
jgi:hypothetical protein